MEFVVVVALTQDGCTGQSEIWSFIVENDFVSIDGQTTTGTINTDATKIIWNNNFTYQKQFAGKCYRVLKFALLSVHQGASVVPIGTQ